MNDQTASELHRDADIPTCQSCGARLKRTLVDLGVQPLANSYTPVRQVDFEEPRFPLHARVCDACLLVQVDIVQKPEEIFSDYAYFSSFSESWLRHCSEYADAMIARFSLGSSSQVIEIASNDGYLLQYFLERDIPVLGIEPAANVAEVAIARGIRTEVAFFGRETAQRLSNAGIQADLLAAKNVLAHVPDINDFAAGIPLVLKSNGVFTVEFPHLLNLLKGVQFDTIYHEHFTYLSLLAVQTIFRRHGLEIFDVEEQPTHGGSLRVLASHERTGYPKSESVEKVIEKELQAGLGRPEGYEGFEAKVRAVREGLNEFVSAARSDEKTIVAYGAAAKGNTLLNYCGLSASDIAFVVDRNPTKQNTLLPGSRIPVRAVETLLDARPDYVLILPWNLTDEIIASLPQVNRWGGTFVTAVPAIRTYGRAI